MKIDIVTLFPAMYDAVLGESIIKRASAKKIVNIKIHNLRHWAQDAHKSVDDRPYGGGVGMVLMIEPIDIALKSLKKKGSKVILTTPQGKTYTQSLAINLSRKKHIIIIAGHYEGYDERIRKLVNLELSIGDYILTGGELPSMVIADSIIRLLPGVLKEQATRLESFSATPQGRLLDFPQYTRPDTYHGMKVPQVLLSGNHAEIAQWRKSKALANTKKRRPDLLSKKP
jgi:tRNA (guanine37-N1)-methyltransferase